MRKDGAKTRKKILSVCVRLFLQQGYKETTVTQIVREAGITRGSYQNQFPTKDAVLMELVKTMFSSQFDMARSIAGDDLPPVYTYAVETSIQLALTELNENLRELYIESYKHPDTAEYIYLQTTSELKNIFAPYLPDHSESDFYDMEIGTSGPCAATWQKNAISTSRCSESSNVSLQLPCEYTEYRKKTRKKCLRSSQCLI